MNLPIFREWVQLVPVCRLVGQIDVASGDTRSSSPHNSRFADGNWEHLFIQNVDVVVRRGTTN